MIVRAAMQRVHPVLGSCMGYFNLLANDPRLPVESSDFVPDSRAWDRTSRRIAFVGTSSIASAYPLVRPRFALMVKSIPNGTVQWGNSPFPVCWPKGTNLQSRYFALRLVPLQLDGNKMAGWEYHMLLKVSISI